MYIPKHGVCFEYCKHGQVL